MVQAGKKSYESRRCHLELLRSQLETERSSFVSHWQDIANVIRPRRPRFTVTDVNRGDRRMTDILDTTGTLAARTLASGMMSGVTSPARAWFRLTVPDPNLSENGAVKDWTHDVTLRTSTVFTKSNLYQALPTAYSDLGCFGTAAIFVEDDLRQVVRFTPIPIGSYMLAVDAMGRVNVFYREIPMTVRQIVEKFAWNEEDADYDWTNISDSVRNLWKEGQREQWLTIVHAVYPNDLYDPNKALSKYKRFASVYYERGMKWAGKAPYLSESDQDKLLSEKGFDLFPVLAPRWEVADGDAYGTDCPGMTALGDVRQLQVAERRALQAIEKMVRPPMIAPSSMRTERLSTLPGDVSYADEREGTKGIRPAHEVNFDLSKLEAKQQQVRQRITRAFYEDLFLMLANEDRRDITATEIVERKEEKLLALGPVLQQLNQDLLNPLIDLTFAAMLRRGLVPQPPKELEGQELKVEFVSVMAQAQKLVNIGTIERFTSFVGNIAQSVPEALDKVVVPQLVDEYGDALGISPKVIRTDEEVQAIQAERKQAMAAQQAVQTANEASSAVRNLAAADMGTDSALSRLAESVGAV